MPRNARPAPGRGPLSFRKKLLFFGSMIAGAAVVIGVCFEILVRIAEPQPPIPRWNQESREYGVELRRNFHQVYPFNGWGFVMDVRTNSEGRRDEELALSEPFAGETLLFLGDSFTFGYAVNVPDRFDRKIVARCRAAGVPVRAINAGMPGWGTVQQFTYARKRMREFDPDVIVLTFCGNDPQDDTTFLQGQVTVEAKEGFFDYPGKRFLVDHLHAYRFVLKRTALWRLRSHLKQKMGANPAARLDRQSGSVITADEWTRTLSEIRQFSEEFAAFNPGGLMLVQASEPTNPEIRSHLRTLTDGTRLFYVDLCEATEAMTPEARRLPWDAHWSPLMHYASGEHLFDVLRAKRGWAPAPDGVREITPARGEGEGREEPRRKEIAKKT